MTTSSSTHDAIILSRGPSVRFAAGLKLAAVMLLFVGSLPWLVAGCQAVLSPRTVGPTGEIGLITGDGSVDIRYLGYMATLTASPAAGWRFDHWKGPGDSSTENPHTIGAERVPYYTAVFVPE